MLIERGADVNAPRCVLSALRGAHFVFPLSS